MKINLRNSMIFFGILVLVLFGMVFSGKLNLSKPVYVISPEENISSEETEEIEENFDKKSIDENQEIIVYISGEVKTPGVVNINNGDRLINAIEKLGGLTENADFNRVNLAIKLEDGFHYIIPKIGETAQEENDKVNEASNIAVYENKQNNTTSSSNKSSSGKVNINNATLEQLNSLPGIGNVIAQRIVDYREQNGGFKSVEDLNNVSGIGDKKFEGIRELICIN